MKRKVLYSGILILVLILATRLIYTNSVDYLLRIKLNNQEKLIVKYEKFITDGLVEKSTKFKTTNIQSVIDTALSYKGSPNKIGGISKAGIDASGLIYMSLKKNSKEKFPRIAQEMARYGERIIDVEKLKKGDLVFFFNTYETERIITSVGIYIGNNEFINSSSSKGVTISEIDDPYFWKDKFFFGTRIFK
jgi:cell wall-associated NlpC family hydrolase